MKNACTLIQRTLLMYQNSRIFSLKTQLKVHLETIHEGSKPYKCEVCNYSAALKNTLKQHTNNVHQGRKDFKCNICGKQFTQKGKVNRHLENIH